MTGQRIHCAGAIIFDRTGRLLLIRRRNAPGAGLWSLPGGRIEPGETDTQAVIREVKEETGLTVVPGRLAGTAELPGPAASVIEVRDYLVTVAGGRLVAGPRTALLRTGGA